MEFKTIVYDGRPMFAATSVAVSTFGDACERCAATKLRRCNSDLACPRDGALLCITLTGSDYGFFLEDTPENRERYFVEKVAEKLEGAS